VQIRYRSKAVPATVRRADSARLELELHTAARAITKGQSGVLYGDDDQLLGGGVIG
jgi:tRNA U34 2-thiouridine synthase MnmA/TrmU